MNEERVSLLMSAVAPEPSDTSESTENSQVPAEQLQLDNAASAAAVAAGVTAAAHAPVSGSGVQPEQAPGVYSRSKLQSTSESARGFGNEGK
eukprot:411732-Rhodomonas_salina.1